MVQTYVINHIKKIFFVLIALGMVSAFALDLPETCSDRPDLQKIRSKELAELLKKDQDDRAHIEGKVTIEEVMALRQKDLTRRKRVSEIIAEGCLSSAADHTAAAMIFQHGDVTDHYYLAYVLAHRAVALGDYKQRSLIAMAVDRYLVSLGQKQLFGTQYFASESTHWCLCIQPMEKDFSDKQRELYTGHALQYQLDQIKSMNKNNPACGQAQAECQEPLRETPQGSVPGIW